jgi:hypothetical protein
VGEHKVTVLSEELARVSKAWMASFPDRGSELRVALPRATGRRHWGSRVWIRAPKSIC